MPTASSALLKSGASCDSSGGSSKLLRPPPPSSRLAPRPLKFFLLAEFSACPPFSSPRNRRSQDPFHRTGGRPYSTASLGRNLRGRSRSVGSALYGGDHQYDYYSAAAHQWPATTAYGGYQQQQPHRDYLGAGLGYGGGLGVGGYGGRYQSHYRQQQQPYQQQRAASAAAMYDSELMATTTVIDPFLAEERGKAVILIYVHG